jgi:hypothetical protein
MKAFIPLAAFIYVTGCSSPEQVRRKELMDIIEKQIRLPSGAEEMNRYARAYKFASSDKIVAAYFLPPSKLDEQFCEGAKEGGQRNGQIALACPSPEGMKADESRWFDNDVYLPDISGDGCGYIYVVYDLRKRAVMYARCNGPM